MSIYKPTWLCVKQHSVTGLKYFCKTTCSDHIKYLGSGKYWANHLNKHGKKHVVTLWSYKFVDKTELFDFAIAFSELYDIVNSAEWANLVIEDGLMGGARPNSYFNIFNKLPKTSEICARISRGTRGISKVRSNVTNQKIANRLIGKKSKFGFGCEVFNIRYSSIIAACKSLAITRYEFTKLVKNGSASLMLT